MQGDLRHLGIPYLFGECCQHFGGINFREQGLWHMPIYTCTFTHVHVQLKAIIACECYNQILSKKDEINWFFMQHLNSFKVGFDLSGRSEEFHSLTGLILNVPLSCGVSLQGGPKHLGIPYSFNNCH